MENCKRTFNERMKILRNAYAQELPGKVEALEEAWRLLLLKEGHAHGIQSVMSSFHSVAGSAASFGYKELSEGIRKGERLLKAVLRDGVFISNIEEEMNDCLRIIKDCCRRRNEQAIANPKLVHSFECICGQREKKTIFLVDDDILLAATMEIQLECFGYEVMKFYSLQEMEQRLAKLIPAAIIMDMVFPEGDTAGAEAISRWRKNFQEYIPVVFISMRNDITARSEAVKVGGDAYFLKPVRMLDLLETLDKLIYKQEQEQYRILIIDDDKTVAKYHSLLLEQHGMQAYIETDPLKILDSIDSFNPDLILLDLNMPGCDGYSLAKVIRQVPAYLSIPIVFLSGEMQLELQLEAMRTGGDDFMSKPVEPKHFISSVRIRAERMRMLRSLMVCDGLSGLYTHTTMKGYIEREFSGSLRCNSPLTLAILDLDYFKTINDTYGHATGDMVIIALSRLLKQRLRKSDIIGRMGGDEFAILLPDTSADYGYQVIEEIHKSFARIHHEAPNDSFTATFSCGLSEMPGYSDETNFFAAADAALYEAKKMGRNQIVLAKNIQNG